MPDYFFALGAGLLFFGPVIGFVLYKELYHGDHRKQRRQFRAVPQLDIKDVGDQPLAKLTGHVQSSTMPLHAPLSGRPCVAWQLEIRHIVRTGKARGGIARREWARSSQHFQLRDETGSANIESVDPWLFVKTEVTKDLSSRDRFSPELQAILAQDPLFSIDSCQLRIIESVVQSEQMVGVVGVCQWLHDPSTVDGYRSPRTQLVVRGGEDSILIGEAAS